MQAHIPAEIFCLIAEALDSPRDRFHLAASCRRIHRLVLPILYSNVPLNGMRAISSFLYSVVRNEKLATAVRFLALYHWEVPDANWSSNDKFEYDVELVDTLMGEVECSEEERAKWIKHLESGVSDAWLALILPRLKGLRTLNIEWPLHAHYVPEMLAKAASEDVPVFPQLEEVYAAWYDTENGFEASLMLPFFKFPAMRKIAGHMLVEDSDVEQTVTRSSPITEIDLINSNSSYGMKSWIESCQALKRFRITYGGALISFDEIDMPALYRSLQLHKATLESVCFCLNNEEISDGSLGSLADFTALKTLHVPISQLTRLGDDPMRRRELKDFLPPSLEKLYLCECFPIDLGWISNQLEDLINLSVLPNLMHLCVEAYYINDPRNEQPRRRLENRCKDAGIIFNAYPEGHEEDSDFGWERPEFTISY